MVITQKLTLVSLYILFVMKYGTVKGETMKKLKCVILNIYNIKLGIV